MNMNLLRKRFEICNRSNAKPKKSVPMKLWLIDFDEAHPSINKPVVVRSVCEPSVQEAERAVHGTGMTMGVVYINSVTETTEEQIKYKKYLIVWGKL